jgi:ATP-dependent DNA helicase PIF1
MSDLDAAIYKAMAAMSNTNKDTMDITLNEQQQRAYQAMIDGKSIFLTGIAGGGKSACVKKFVQAYKDSKNIGLTSTTGISAVLIGGCTVHSYLGIGLGTGSVDSLSTNIMRNGKLRKRWNELQVLIIDEISMFSPELFDKIEQVARCVRYSEAPFGGIQLVLTGDMLQLPAIGSENLCFESKSWDSCIDEVIYLTENHRQLDPKFQQCLNNVRLGKLPKSTRKMLESRIGVKLTNELGIMPTKIYCTNASVDYKNQQELDKLNVSGAEFYEYEIEYEVFPSIKNKEYMREKYKKMCMAPETLQLCVGAQVMLLFNLEVEQGLANGSRGIVDSFVDDIPVVKFLNGRKVAIDHHVWTICEGDEQVMKIIQIPLKLAYAASAHKLQGSTLDYAEVNLIDCFEWGQAYIMISRVKTLEGLSIIAIDFDKICAHPKALKYYDNLLACQE